jgi:hypothetical protein
MVFSLSCGAQSDYGGSLRLLSRSFQFFVMINNSRAAIDEYLP